jgi:recombinational DNA repair protein (RecF pathway)
VRGCALAGTLPANCEHTIHEPALLYEQLAVVTRTDSAILLRKTPYGETSLVVHVLTPARGRVPLMAKGAHRPNSRFCGVLDWFDTLTLEWSESPRRELQLLASGDLEQRRRSIPRALGAYRAAQIMLELSELATRPGQPEAGLFVNLACGLDRLDQLARLGIDGEADADSLAAATDRSLIEFELAFLQNLGILPALGACAACGREAPPVTHDRQDARVAFSADSGGRLCPSCAAEARARGRRVGTLPQPVLDAANALLEAMTSPDAALTARQPGSATNGPLDGATVRLDDHGPEMTIRMRDLLERFLDYHLDARPKTLRRFLDAPNRNAPIVHSP